MPKKTKKVPHQKAHMRAKHPDHPGVERDNHGKTIPLSKRLPEDRAVAKRAAKKRKRKTPAK